MTHESWQDPPGGYRDSIEYNAAMNARDFDNQDREPLEAEPLTGPVNMDMGECFDTTQLLRWLGILTEDQYWNERLYRAGLIDANTYWRGRLLR